jgi:transcriptional regulator with XRE-family HTH domain
MTLSATGSSVGDRIRARRKELGLTVAHAAGLAGMSTSQLSRMERGQRGCDNRFAIADIARALRCTSEHLTGVHVPGAELSATTNDTVRALIHADLEFPAKGVDLPPLAQLTERTDQAIELRKACKYADLTRLLPALVRDLYAAAAGPDSEEALRMMVRAAEAASFAVRFTGQAGAANLAAERARQAAKLLDDPVHLAFGEWARAHAALGCGLHDRAAVVTEQAIRVLTPAPAGPGKLEMLGMLHLTVAFAYVGDGRHADAVAPLAEANALATRTGETGTFGLMFGPTNCRLWELAILTDGGDPLDALPLISDTNPRLIASASRQAAFYTDASRLLHKLNHTDQAVQFMETAERIAPERVHGDPIAVETIRSMLETVRRQATSTRLAGLAQRVGVRAS